MSVFTRHGTSAERIPHDIVESAPFEWFARAGFIARAIVYGTIGVLALKLALGAGGKATDQQGAMRTLARQPFGEVLLVLLAVGLAGYAMWRLFRAALGRGPEGSDRGIERIGALGSGIVYAVFFVVALEVLLGSGGGASGNTRQTTAGILGWPAGRWIVLVAGLVMVGVGLYQGFRGLTHGFEKDWKTEQMGATTKRWLTWAATVGHLARAIVFTLIGVFLAKAALAFDAKEAVGLDGALAKLGGQTGGSALLGLVAAGLIAFALYSLADARYRRI